MGRIAISKNFYLDEFIPIHVYHNYLSRALWFIRPEVVSLAQFYRDWFDAPVTVNNWYSGGPLQQRGYREPNSTTGARLSQHKFGCAFDCSIGTISPDEVRSEILNNEATFMKAGLTTLEHGDYAPTWVHSDIRWTGLDRILIVKPANIQALEEEFSYNPLQRIIMKD